MYWNIVVCVVAVSIIVWIVLSKKLSKKSKETIPGPKVTDSEEGNIPDIKAAGSLHEYVRSLHQQHGPIVAFSLKKQRVVSIASPELFKEHQNVFDRPVELFQMQRDLIGEHSIQLRNGSDGQQLHKTLSRPFAFTECKKYYADFHTIGKALIDKIKAQPPETHIPIHEYMTVVAIKGILATAFGYQITDDKLALEIHETYNAAWNKIESYFKETKSDLTEEQIKTAASKYRNYAEEFLDARKKSGASEDLFVDLLLQSEESKENQIDNATTFITGGFHTTANLLTWMIYFVAKDEQIQEKVYQEIDENLGNEDVTPETFKNLKYLQQVIDETLRASTLAPYAARCSHKDCTLGGYLVTADTPVLHALGVVLNDETFWKNSQQFDPDRFSVDAVKTRPSLAFSPFGFAGKRICPGYRFAYVEATIIMSLLVRNFKLRLVDGQTVFQIFGLVTKPSSEIWVTVDPRVPA